MKKRYDIEKQHFESVFNDRFLEFFDNYPQSKSLIKTYGLYEPDLIRAYNKIDAFITNVNPRQTEKVKEIKEHLEFIKDYFNLKNYELEFYNENNYYSTIYYGRKNNRVFFYGEYVQCRFTR